MADIIRAIAVPAPRHSAEPEPELHQSRPSGRVSAIAAKFEPRHFCQDEINAMPTEDLQTIVRGTVPTGIFMMEVAWARSELRRRELRA